MPGTQEITYMVTEAVDYTRTVSVPEGATESEIRKAVYRDWLENGSEKDIVAITERDIYCDALGDLNPTPEEAEEVVKAMEA